MLNANRWERVRASLAAAGIDATVTVRNYPGGVSHSILLRTPSGSLVTIADTVWPKNYDIWTGYQVTVENTDGIIVSTSPRTKKRSELVQFVAAVMPTNMW